MKIHKLDDFEILTSWPRKWSLIFSGLKNGLVDFLLNYILKLIVFTDENTL